MAKKIKFTIATTTLCLAIGIAQPPATQAQIERFPATLVSFKSVVKMMYHAQGGTNKQFNCLDKVWTMESHWNYKDVGTVMTTQGRAYGIPQALPANKMAVEGKDWRINPYTQVRWGLRYIYYHWHNNACAALRNEREKGFY